MSVSCNGEENMAYVSNEEKGNLNIRSFLWFKNFAEGKYRLRVTKN